MLKTEQIEAELRKESSECRIGELERRIREVCHQVFSAKESLEEFKGKLEADVEEDRGIVGIDYQGPTRPATPDTSAEGSDESD